MSNQNYDENLKISGCFADHTFPFKGTREVYSNQPGKLFNAYKLAPRVIEAEDGAAPSLSPMRGALRVKDVDN